MTDNKLQLIGDELFYLLIYYEELVTQAKKMAVVYTAIAAFENSIRKFVSKKLIEVHGEDWWDKVPPGIRTKAQTQKEKEEKIRWHTPRGDTNINYTEFGDLITIMRLNWIDFEPHIISLEWADNIIKSIELSRNVIMHSGESSNQDIERIGTFIRNWTNQVG
jgi:hypothetical protein